MANEINLVPDIKNEMIKTLKMRNLIFFLCIVVASVSAGVALIFGLIEGGQKLAIEDKKTTINDVSAKLNSYTDLKDFITIQDQLGKISTITDNKKVLSRTFNILSAFLPTGADTIKVSELRVNLADEKPTLSFDAQANAGKEPYIDYNVLDSFKKSMEYMKYDYGRYVDREGNTIPSYCMIEYGADGALLTDSGTGSVYAYWTVDGEGCSPTKNSSTTTSNSGYEFESYDGQRVVRIWRTPQFNAWYTSKKMNLDGTISGVEHFESACTKYIGDASKNSSSPTWTSSNEECLLVPNGIEGIRVTDSSNGRDSSNELVLRFSAIITLDPSAYKFTNTHMIALPPSGRHNVTDSYVQIQAMFSERAADCTEGDSACKTEGQN